MSLASECGPPTASTSARRTDLAESGSRRRACRAGARLLVFERYAFVLFCSHLLFMWLLAPLIGRLTGPMGSPGWALFFVIQPALALGFAMLLALAIERVSPKAAALLSGGRLR